MVVGLNKKSIPFVITACPERKICGHWLAEEIEESLKTLGSIGLFVRAIISDNHAINVLAFKNLRRKFGNIDDKACFYFDGKKVYNLHDSVHLRFIFPEFEFNGFSDIIRIDAGE